MTPIVPHPPKLLRRAPATRLTPSPRGPSPLAGLGPTTGSYLPVGRQGAEEPGRVQEEGERKLW